MKVILCESWTTKLSLKKFHTVLFYSSGNYSYSSLNHRPIQANFSVQMKMNVSVFPLLSTSKDVIKIADYDAIPFNSNTTPTTQNAL